MLHVCAIPWPQGDNWRERALDMMMGGRLEANAEEELFKVTHTYTHHQQWSSELGVQTLLVLQLPRIFLTLSS